MTTPLEAFSACSDENRQTISVIVAAMEKAFEQEGDGRKECTLLDCGTGNGQFVSDLVRENGFPCHVFGTDINSDMLETAISHYRDAGALSAQAVQADIAKQDSDTIRHALGWDYDRDDVDAHIHKADVVLLSHVGYFIPRSLQPKTIATLSRLTGEKGMMVFTHSDGYSQFNDLRDMMGKEIHTADNAMYFTHARMYGGAVDAHRPSFTVEVPCNLHLPNDELALYAAWFGTDRGMLTDEQLEHVTLFENVISFAANNTPIQKLREQLGEDALERIWRDFWVPRMDECAKKDELQLSVAGGKMTFTFGQGKERLAWRVRDAVETFCLEKGMKSLISDVSYNPQPVRAGRHEQGWSR